MEPDLAPMLVRSLLIALAVYALAVRFAYWRVPRSRHWGPGTVLSFLGALFGTSVLAPAGVGASVLGAVLGALGSIFAAVKIGTPASVVLTVDCEGISGDAKAAAAGQRAPFVWPGHFSVEKLGHVSFALVGEPGTEVTLEFPPETTPFGRDRDGEPRCRFEGVVPGRIDASPVVRPGQGKFTVTKRSPKTGETAVNDRTWSVPRRKE